MAITVKNISEMFGKDVFTTRGAYAGKVEDVELNLSKFRIHSLTIAAARGSMLSNIIGGKARGVRIPYNLVDNVGDVVIIKHITAAPQEEKSEEAVENY